MVTVPHIMVGLERLLDYRGVGLARFHCSSPCILFSVECWDGSSNVHGLVVYYCYFDCT